MASAISTVRSAPGTANGLSTARQARVGAILVGFLVQSFASVVKALPLTERAIHALEDEDLPKSPEDAGLWAYLGTAIALVLLGGAFAGLTIA